MHVTFCCQLIENPQLMDSLSRESNGEDTLSSQDSRGSTNGDGSPLCACLIMRVEQTHNPAPGEAEVHEGFATRWPIIGITTPFSRVVSVRAWFRITWLFLDYRNHFPKAA